MILREAARRSGDGQLGCWSGHFAARSTNGFVVSFVVPPWENASPFSKILRDKGKKS
jgi:hypothetical protein